MDLFTTERHNRQRRPGLRTNHRYRTSTPARCGRGPRPRLPGSTDHVRKLAVESRHIFGRIRLYVDLEQLQVDDIGNWDALRDEPTLPETTVPTDSNYEYRDLPSHIEYSVELLDRLRQRWAPAP